MYRVVGDCTRYAFPVSRAREHGGEELRVTLVLNDIRSLGGRIGRTSDLTLARAKEE